MATLGPTLGPRGGSARVSPRTIAPPKELGWTLPFSIIDQGGGSFTSTINLPSLMPATVTDHFVDSTRPHNGGDGLTWGAADQAIWAALNDIATAGVAARLYILGSADPDNPVIYDYDKAWRFGLAVDAQVIVVSDTGTLAPGYAVSSMAMLPGGSLLGAWALGPAQPTTYQATLAAAPHTVIDATTPNFSGEAGKLTLRASTAAVEANPGSYYWAAGVLYVRTADSRAPDASLRVLKASNTNGHINGAGKDYYIQGLSFEGGGPARAFYGQFFRTLTMVDCTASNGEALGIEANTNSVGVTHTVYLLRCSGLGGGGDGLGGTIAGAGTTLNWYSQDCRGAGNNGAGSDQGESLHKVPANTAVRAVRVNCTTESNGEQGYADVGGMLAWLVGCRPTDETTGVYIGGAGTAWLHGCVMTGCTTDLVTDDAGGRIYVDSTTQWATSSGPGIIDTYVP